MTTSVELKGIARRCAIACLASVVAAAALWWQGSVLWLPLMPAALGVFFGGASLAAVLAVKKLKEPIQASGIDPAVRAEMNRQITRWHKAINEFGALMEEHSMSVLPEAALPLPKADMKEALRFAWFASPHARPNIEAGYIHLAQFQPDISVPIRLDVPYEPAGTPLEMAEQVLAWSKRTKLIRSVVEAEEQALFAELAAMKVGPPPFAEHLG